MADTILTTEYTEEMQKSYMDYAMSVITARAVPDVRDGLKPVQRRVLYDMHLLGLNSDKPHRKSARIVGDAMGKFHPHGDSSIYDALVVLSQDFKKGIALIDGHGNFGSIEGDGAAAMRYTEARLKKFTQEVYLKDLDKDVVDFQPNYDENEKEPEVLPVRIPNFLVNGSEGIAVGMTTSCPTHNLSEVISAMEMLMEDPNTTTRELLEVMPGPDFPTGGIVANLDELAAIYETGRGKIKLRGKAEFIPAKKRSEKDRIVISEIPYTMVGAAIGKFLNDVAELVEKKVFPEITDISNMSGKDGINIVIELKSGADGEKILSGLYKKTKLEDTFGVNMLCIVNGKPETLGLKRILEENIKFQFEINNRKYTNLLKKEEQRKEIQEGLIKAVDIIDLIIEVIRGSKKLQTAKECLMNGTTEGIAFKSEESKKEAAKLHFTEAQAQAILDLRLAKLIGLEIQQLKAEYKETKEKIATYRKLLSSPYDMRKAIVADLENIRKEFGYPRRTLITNAEEAVYEEAPEQEIPVLLSMNRFGYLKMYDLSVYEKNKEAVEEESKTMIFCRNTSKICLFTDNGLCHQFRMKDVPLSRLKDKGVPLDNISNYDSSQETILAMESFDDLKAKTLIFATSSAMIKRVEALEFESVKKTTAATKLADGDRLIYVSEALGENTALVTKNGYVLRFRTDEISLYKKTSVGVRGMKLEKDDELAAVYDFDPSVRCVVKVGKKSVDLSKLKLKKRDQKPDLIK
ncbi:MAG: DNA topoisomerase 4 subunit A [Lachnospiraceae bacterium]|nr:DNA topoisomerase 4 subunit A [Lachnospiraceae bacterium]